MKISKLLPFVWMLALAASPAFAQVKVGVTVSATGPQASLGVPEVNAIGLLAKDIDQLPDSNPVKKNALGFVKEDEASSAPAPSRFLRPIPPIPASFWSRPFPSR